MSSTSIVDQQGCAQLSKPSIDRFPCTNKYGVGNCNCPLLSKSSGVNPRILPVRKHILLKSKSKVGVHELSVRMCPRASSIRGRVQAKEAAVDVELGAAGRNWKRPPPPPLNPKKQSIGMVEISHDLRQIYSEVSRIAVRTCIPMLPQSATGSVELCTSSSFHSVMKVACQQTALNRLIAFCEEKEAVLRAHIQPFWLIRGWPSYL